MNPKNPPNNKPVSLNNKKSPIPDPPAQIPETIVSLKKQQDHKSALETSLSALPIKKISTAPDQDPSHRNSSTSPNNHQHQHNHHHHHHHHQEPIVNNNSGNPSNNSRTPHPEKRKIPPQSPVPSPQKKPKSQQQDTGTERFIELFRRQQQQLQAQKTTDKRKQRGVKRNRD